ncbi:hypothetical protein Bca52824_052351 [Brassica carinata]|uniref:Uncharacterized protein n=1 Tax=Brassica carinata TaxID=52824 RepID=A0A8X7UKQ2_BRACI|nr:hypothetical protein Bca52824_052351 [Brassica carinata]
MEEAVDTAVEAVAVMEAMVEDVSVDTMVVVGGGGYSSGGDGGGYGGGRRREGGGYGGGDGGNHRNGGCGVRREGSYTGGVSGSTRLPSTRLSSTHLPSTHLSLVHNELPFTSETTNSLCTYHKTHLIHLHLRNKIIKIISQKRNILIGQRTNNYS